MAGVDETDRAILSALRENSRQPYVDLAKTVGVSERTIRTRVRRLEEDGVIRSYTIREKGIGLTALVRMKVGPCLLYTSPSPRDRTRSRMPSSA